MNESAILSVGRSVRELIININLYFIDAVSTAAVISSVVGKKYFTN